MKYLILLILLLQVSCSHWSTDRRPDYVPGSTAPSTDNAEVSHDEFKTNTYNGVLQWLRHDALDEMAFDANARLPELRFPELYNPEQRITPSIIISGAKLLRQIDQDIVHRMKTTFAGKDDGQENVKDRRQKWMHPFGACAEVEWQMDTKHASTDLTGLFMPGTTVPGIVRFSTGTIHTKWPESREDGRLFSFAVMLFPSSNPNKEVETVNIFTLDRFGFLRSKRDHYFQPGTNMNEPDLLFFTNLGNPHMGPQGQNGTLIQRGQIAIGNHFFDKIDKPNAHRPLEPLARTYMDGRTPSLSASTGGATRIHAPSEIWFIPEVEPKMLKDNQIRYYEDLRYELIDFEPSDIKFGIYRVREYPEQTLPNNRQEVVQPENRIGQLVVTGKPFLSPTCDLDFHFKHEPHPSEGENPLGDRSNRNLKGQVKRMQEERLKRHRELNSNE